MKINFLDIGGKQAKRHVRYTRSLLASSSLLVALVICLPMALNSATGPEIVAPTILDPIATEIVTEQQPYIRGVTVNNTLIDVYVDGIYNGRAIVKDHPSGTASWAYQVFLPLEYGDHTMYAVARSNDELFRSHESISVRFRTEAPLPTPSALELRRNEVQWRRPILKGMAKSSTFVQIFIDGELRTVIESPDRTEPVFGFKYTPPQDLSPGWHSFKVRARDARGKLSRFSKTLVVEIREHATTPLRAPDLVGELADPASQPEAATLLRPENGSVGSLTTPDIVGRAPSQHLVQIYIDETLNGEIEIKTNLSEISNFSYKPWLPLIPGSHTVHARVMNDLGQRSGRSNTLSFFIRGDRSNFIVTETEIKIPEKVPTPSPSLTQTPPSSTVTPLQPETNDGAPDKMEPEAPEPSLIAEEIAESKRSSEEPEAMDETRLESRVIAETSPETGTSNTGLIIGLAILVIIVVGVISWLTTKPVEIDDQPKVVEYVPPPVSSQAKSSETSSSSSSAAPPPPAPPAPSPPPATPEPVPPPASTSPHPGPAQPSEKPSNELANENELPLQPPPPPPNR